MGILVGDGFLGGIAGPDVGLNSAAALAAHKAGRAFTVGGLIWGNFTAAGEGDKSGKQESQTHGAVIANDKPVASLQNTCRLILGFRQKCRA